jgi:hypothetical protein
MARDDAARPPLRQAQRPTAYTCTCRGNTRSVATPMALARVGAPTLASSGTSLAPGARPLTSTAVGRSP